MKRKLNLNTNSHHLTGVLLALIFAVTTTSSKEAISAGGELGNGFVKYTSHLNHFSISYPKDWSYYDMSSVVRFINDSSLPMELSSSISVLSKNLTQISSIEDLELYVRFFHPGNEWQKISFNKMQALWNGTWENGGIMYLLRGAQDVLFVSIKSTMEEEVLKKIRATVSSLEVE